VGFSVQQAKNGREAIELWERWRPHLIFMDLRMPVMNGYEAIARIKTKRSEHGRNPVIIALTASAFEEDRIEVIRHGGDDFVRKPFQENEIFEMLSKHLGVEFIYETTKEDENIKSAMPIEKMQQAIAELPVALKSEFKTAVVRVDFEHTLALRDAIREENEDLAIALTNLVNGYEFDTLQELFRE
jgi:CheY-like chemotaxis protein